MEVELWLENNRSVDSLVSSDIEVEEEIKEDEEGEEDDLEYFDTFPSIELLRHVYDRDERTVMFEKDNEKNTFKMPHKMERFKDIDIEDLKTNNIPPFVIENDDSNQENP
uniref:Uncharacterized protein n=1 Tax=Tanacetum cinerariifolium TaxID=118510 RepID=A0A6L2KSX1_TANCI|nr:hypothetical protein [Tanacetum cinerariifolium]